MEVVYELNSEDLFALKKYERAQYAKDNSVKRIAFVSFFIFSLAEFYTLSSYLADWWIYFLFSNGIFASCFYLLSLLWKTLSDKKSASNNNKAFCSGTIKAEFNDKVIRFVSEDSKASYSWKSIKRIESRRHHILIQTFPDNFYVIPKRCFENDAHRAAFLQTAIDYAQQSKEIEKNTKVGERDNIGALYGSGKILEAEKSPVQLLFSDGEEK